LGRGPIWRRSREEESVVEAEPGLRLTIPLRTQFRFSAAGVPPLSSP